MADEKALVVYYSRTGNTQKLAGHIAERLGARLEELHDLNARLGVWGFFRAAMHARSKRLTHLRRLQYHPADYDLVVIGTPVWAWTMTPAVRTYLTRHQGELPDKVGFFVTAGGGAMNKTLHEMAEVSGREPIATLAVTATGVYRDAVHDQLEEFENKLRGQVESQESSRVR